MGCTYEKYVILFISSYQCPSLQREGQEGGEWDLSRYKSAEYTWKIYGKVIIKRVQRLIEEKIGKEQGGFRKRRKCVVQIFSFRMVVEKILAQGENYTLPSWI